MKQYLIDTFKFNDRANITIIAKIFEMPSPDKAINLFSHLIYSQNKWMARVLNDPNEQNLEWFGKPISVNELATNWDKSISNWINYLEKLNEDKLTTEIRYVSSEGRKLGVLLKDIALQLNYHSIHHRAQICMMLREQNIDVPFIEYIGGVVKRY